MYVDVLCIATLPLQRQILVRRPKPSALQENTQNRISTSRKQVGQRITKAQSRPHPRCIPCGRPLYHGQQPHIHP